MHSFQQHYIDVGSAVVCVFVVLLNSYAVIQTHMVIASGCGTLEKLVDHGMELVPLGGLRYLCSCLFPPCEEAGRRHSEKAVTKQDLRRCLALPPAR